MSGGVRLEAFVSAGFFWSYFASGEIKGRDIALARSLNI